MALCTKCSGDYVAIIGGELGNAKREIDLVDTDTLRWWREKFL